MRMMVMKIMGDHEDHGDDDDDELDHDNNEDQMTTSLLLRCHHGHCFELLFM